MNLEKEILSYLYKYGNTRETDMLRYCGERFGCSSEEAKKVIQQMVVKGEIHYIVHSKLEPPEVYISLKESLHPEISKVLIDALVQARNVEEDAKRILKEAEKIAEEKRKEKRIL